MGELLRSILTRSTKAQQQFALVGRGFAESHDTAESRSNGSVRCGGLNGIGLLAQRLRGFFPVVVGPYHYRLVVYLLYDTFI